MKDIVISERRIKRELWVFLACVVAMEMVNIYAVFEYGGKWTEIFTSLGFVVTSALCLYAVIAVVRLIISGISGLIKK